jgi:hypothetical protein
MMSKIISKLLLIFIISCFLSGQAFAVYKHKVIVTEFDDPQGWMKSYHPGEILSRHLKQHLMDEGRFHILETSMNGKMPGSVMMNGPHGGMKEKSEIQEGSGKIKGSSAGYQSLKGVESSVRYVSNNSFSEILPVQDSMMNDMDKMPAKVPMMHDPVPWPVRLGSIADKASLFEIKGQVVKFDPGNKNAAMMDKDKVSTTEQAELEVMLQLVQNKTGRVIYKQKFRAFSNSGRRPFSKELDMSFAGEGGKESSSMSIALSFLTREMFSFVNNTISKDPLEGEIIAIKNEDVLINIGSQNGVRVGDRFRVHSVGLKLNDPLTEYDLGDIYVKMGVIQVLESMLGFSKAKIIVGKDFMPGNLVRSFKHFKSYGQQFSSGEALSESEDPVPWWSFHDIKSVP